MAYGRSKEEIAKKDELFGKGLMSCSVCGRILSCEMFHKNKSKKYGIETTCKECSSIREKIYKSNKSKAYVHNSNSRYSMYKHSAKRKGLEFDLTKDDFERITSNKCFYCGEFVEDEFGNKYVGIDRIDPSHGYTYSNIVPCCSMCNYMKYNYSLKEWILQINKILMQNKIKGK